jgi:hypothetical protein
LKLTLELVFLYMILKGSWPGLSVFIHEIKWMLISTVLNRRSIKYIFLTKMCNFGDIWGSVYLKICINDLKQKDLKYLGTVTSICDCIWNDVLWYSYLVQNISNFWQITFEFCQLIMWIFVGPYVNIVRSYQNLLSVVLLVLFDESKNLFFIKWKFLLNFIVLYCFLLLNIYGGRCTFWFFSFSILCNK